MIFFFFFFGRRDSRGIFSHGENKRKKGSTRCDRGRIIVEERVEGEEVKKEKEKREEIK